MVSLPSEVEVGRGECPVAAVGRGGETMIVQERRVL